MLQIGQGFEIGAKRFQIGAEITNQCRPWFVLAIYDLFVFMAYWAEAYSNSCQTSNMLLFAKIVNN